MLTNLRSGHGWNDGVDELRSDSPQCCGKTQTWYRSGHNTRTHESKHYGGAHASKRYGWGAHVVGSHLVHCPLRQGCFHDTALTAGLNENKVDKKKTKMVKHRY